MLLVGEASVLDVDEDGRSLLAWSIFHHGQSKQSTEIVKLLLEAGSDPKQEDHNMISPYTYAWTGFLRHGDHQMFTRELLDMFGSSADLESLCLSDLHAAVLGIGTAPLAETLAATEWSDVDKGDLIGMTALAWAATRSDILAIKQLLAKGADPNLADNQGRTALHHWVKGGNHNCLEVLLDAGAEADRRDKFGETPFLRAMYFFKNVEARSLDLLVSRGADPGRRSHEGWTGIHLTVRWNWNDTARLDCLLRHGLDINQMDEDQMTPLMIAVVHNLPEAIDALLERGASHLGRMKGGRPLLHVIAAYADMASLEVLGRYQELMDSLDPNLPDDAGQSPLEIARTRVAQQSNPAGNDGEKAASAELQRDWYEAFLLLVNEVFFDVME